MTDEIKFRNPYADVLRESPDRKYTWVIVRPDSRGITQRVAFCWLAWQGSEWSVNLPDQSSRQNFCEALQERFCDDLDRTVRETRSEDIYRLARSDRYPGPKHHDIDSYRRTDWIGERRGQLAKGEFTTLRATITPHDVLDILPDGCSITIHPTSRDARRQFAAIGIDLMGRQDIEYLPDMLPEASPVAEWSLLMVDDETRVQDHGKLGVAIVFRDGSSGEPSTKWFIDGAADQIREFGRDSEMIARFVDRQVPKYEPEPEPMAAPAFRP